MPLVILVAGGMAMCVIGTTWLLDLNNLPVDQSNVMAPTSVYIQGVRMLSSRLQMHHDSASATKKNLVRLPKKSRRMSCKDWARVNVTRFLGFGYFKLAFAGTFGDDPTTYAIVLPRGNAKDPKEWFGHWQDVLSSEVCTATQLRNQEGSHHGYSADQQPRPALQRHR